MWFVGHAAHYQTMSRKWPTSDWPCWILPLACHLAQGSVVTAPCEQDILRLLLVDRIKQVEVHFLLSYPPVLIISTFQLKGAVVFYHHHLTDVFLEKPVGCHMSWERGGEVELSSIKIPPLSRQRLSSHSKRWISYKLNDLARRKCGKWLHVGSGVANAFKLKKLVNKTHYQRFVSNPKLAELSWEGSRFHISSSSSLIPPKTSDHYIEGNAGSSHDSFIVRWPQAGHLMDLSIQHHYWTDKGRGQPEFSGGLCGMKAN